MLRGKNNQSKKILRKYLIYKNEIFTFIIYHLFGKSKLSNGTISAKDSVKNRKSFNSIFK